MIQPQEIHNRFPELKWIKNETLRNQVAKTWSTAANKGGWTNLDDVPFTLLIENSGRLVDHTRRITKLAWNVGNTREEPLNKDYLIAGAILHDVGKLLEYEIKNGKAVKSEFGKQYRHPVSGSNLAKELGLPAEVVHIIYAHSKEGDTIQRSLEAIIVNHCDFIDFEIKKILVK
ncbi:MAG: HD domain-containing protein [Candidatus Thermoplasmatota archaeon]|nr:HD domain-containing protein [Candidatus Thermoplasmatota archaeon]MBU1940690.1 HD domain-containing protein [Candidatus Thermoplasmatota archaeon]